MAPADEAAGGSESPPARLTLVAPAVAPDSTLLRDARPGAHVVHVSRDRLRPRSWDGVVVVAHDLLDLRAAATALGAAGTATTISLWLERCPPQLPGLMRQADWPPLEEVSATRGVPTVLRLRFCEPAPVRAVVTQLARASSPSMAATIQWPTLGARRDEVRHWPVNDPTARVAPPAGLFDTGADLPPDVIVVANAKGSDRLGGEPHAVLGRASVVRNAPPEMSWEALAKLEADERATALAAFDPVSLGPVDELLFNPIGFDRDPTGAAVVLRPRRDGSLVAEPDTASSIVVADPSGRVSDADLAALRRLAGLRLEWVGCRGPHDYCRVVSALACAGVPLTTDAVPDHAQRLLGEELSATLVAPVDLLAPLSREEHSIRLRRAGLLTHATSPWRRRLAASSGVQVTGQPRVSVMLATRRPDMLRFALGQLSRQRGVDFEVVVAAHGFEPTHEVLADFTSRCAAPLTVVECDSSTVFGQVLNQAAAVSQGDVLLKVDDDDWYGPHFICDLLLARGYSGAALVGAFPEITYLEPLNITIRRSGPSESYNMFVAGGTLMIGKDAFRGIGGFRETRKYVDASLIRSIYHSGAGVYRTHGLGYVLRRRDDGHTWDPGLGYFLAQERVAAQWRGFRPSSVLEPADSDVPAQAR